MAAQAASQAASRRRSSTHRQAPVSHHSTAPSATEAKAAARASLATAAPWLGGGPVGEPAVSTHSRTVRPAAKRLLTGTLPARSCPSGAVHRAGTQEEPNAHPRAGGGAPRSKTAGTWHQERAARWAVAAA